MYRKGSRSASSLGFGRPETVKPLYRLSFVNSSVRALTACGSSVFFGIFLPPHGVCPLTFSNHALKVTFNYCYVRYDEEARECLCGHPNCVRTLGTKRGEVDEKLEGMSRARGGAGGAGSCSRAGGNGHGNRSNGRGRRGRSSPKLEDPETGETVRRWLHPEDAEVIPQLYPMGQLLRHFSVLVLLLCCKV